MASSAEGNAETKPATFAGRLNLQAFAFDTASSPSSLRRSPRHHDTSGSPQALLAPPPARPTPTPSPTPSLKRRGISSDASAGSSPSPTKKRGAARGRSSGYAPPSVYAHLKGLTDALGPDLLVMMVGLNPGVRTAQSGHAYAHPSNLFWKLMHSSGVTTRLCRPEEDQDMPRLFHVGLTNIVARPSRNGAELSKGEMDEGVAVLEAKARAWRPEAVCFVGKSIWESVWRVRHGRALAKKEFKYGWQDESEIFASVPGDGDGDEGWRGARVFVASSTSGLAATLSTAEKERIWRELGAWVEERRAARLVEVKAENGGDPGRSGGEGEECGEEGLVKREEEGDE